MTTSPGIEKAVHSNLFPCKFELDMMFRFNQTIFYLSDRSLFSLINNSMSASEKYHKNIISASDSGIYNRLYILDRRKNYYVVVGYGMNTDSNLALHFHLNSIKILKKFLYYFESKAEELIYKTQKYDLIFFPYYFDDVDFSIQSSAPVDFREMN